MTITMMLMTMIDYDHDVGDNYQPRKIGRKEMAVGTIQAKAIIRQATLTVNNCDDDHSQHDDRDDHDDLGSDNDLSHVDDTGNNDDGGQTDYNAADDDYVQRNAV